MLGDDLRIIFAGTPANAAETLLELHDAGHQVVGVLTRVDAPIGRTKEVVESPVAALASRLGIELFKSNVVDDKAREWVSSLNPDIGVIVAYGSILKADDLAVPQKGWINLHYSLLPNYPGASPVQHSILEGETITGVTVFELDEGVDSGPILSQKICEIQSSDTAGILLERLSKAGIELLLATLANFEGLSEAKAKQPAVSGIPVTKKISRQMAKLDFGLTAGRIVNLVRGMNPEPIAWFELDSQPVRVLEASVSGAQGISNGLAQLMDRELVVGCANGAVVLAVVQPAGKKPMTGADWFRGLRRDAVSLT